MNKSDKKFELFAPMNGVLIPIEKVPDPTFSEKMVGDGISIDPLEGVLRAPCSGEVAMIHRNSHAITIKTDSDIEILLHIGLDTVKLNGDGFTTKVSVGDSVNVGDELILFDMKKVASNAPSLLTQVIVSTMDKIDRIEPVKATKISSGDKVCTVYFKENSTEVVEKVFSEIELVAPLSGVIVPIENVPDPVFSEKMVGDGISIDPTDSLLLAPCSGEVTFIHKSNHAVTITADSGIDIVVHIGLETVSLKGSGFTLKTKLGQKVSPGDPLIEFDPEYLATNAKSLLTQIVVTNMERVEKMIPASGVISAGDPLCKVILNSESGSKESAQSGETVKSNPISLVNPTGLHARPAAVLATLAKQFTSSIELKVEDRKANAKSITSIMKLNTTHGDSVTLVATGSDSKEAIAAIVPQLESGLGDEGCKPAPVQASTEVTEESAPAPRIDSGDPGTLLGVAASAGIATGTIFQITSSDISVPETGGSIADERKRVEVAIDSAKSQLEALRSRLHAEGNAPKAAIFAAHMELLEDPDLQEIVEASIVNSKSAEYAWKSSYEQQSKELAALNNELLAERANDMVDVGRRVLSIITGEEIKETQFPEGSILVAEDLTPSMTATLDPSIVRGFCTTRGGATSHVAILARSLGIPAVAGINPAALELKNGQMVVVDGTKGNLKTDPSETYIKNVETVQKKIKLREATELESAKEIAITTDNYQMEVVGNVGKPSEAEKILSLGGEGVGLLRSEFIFMDRATAPTEDEQYEAYKSVAESVGKDSRVVIRTLDVGGDKPLAYLPLPKEENPFLGERGIRVGLNRPELLRIQLRALLRASAHGNIHIMFPMIGIMQELIDAKAILEEERIKLGVDPVPTGIMIEVPSAALLADQFAKEVDFFSIGTNDLTQYTLAMDRGHPLLAAKLDGLHPAVLKLIKLTTEAAHANGKWAGICGGLGGDPQAVPILLGLGVDELSVSIPSIPAVKAQIRSLSKSDCEELAKRALEAISSEEVRGISPNPYSSEMQLDEEK
jgi:phosphoenolpyruvate-protein phosphotransferase